MHFCFIQVAIFLRRFCNSCCCFWSSFKLLCLFDISSYSSLRQNLKWPLLFICFSFFRLVKFWNGDLVNKSKIWLFKSISCYSRLITLNFKGHQDAHIRISFYFIFLKTVGCKCKLLAAIAGIQNRRGVL